MKKVLCLLAAAVLGCYSILAQTEQQPTPSATMLEQVARLKAKGIPLTDYHIHIRGGMTPDKAYDWMKLSGIRSGVLENAGREWPLSDDDKIKEFIEDARRFPELLIGLQVNDRDWFKMIDPKVVAMLDFTLADAMILDGQRLWLENEYTIDDENVWLDRIFKNSMAIVNEPITIFANPTYLPNRLVPRYDEFWTKDRMLQFIDAAVKNNVALEIQAGTNFPTKEFIILAIEKGAKITIGRNNNNDRINELKRSLDWLEELDIKPEHMLDLKKK